MRFSGNFEAKLDAKNRVFIPAGFRRLLQSSLQQEDCLLYLRKDIFQDCIVLYPEPVWEAELTQLRSRLNKYDPEQQDVYRQFMLEAECVEMSANGRVLLPKRLLAMVGIDSEVRFLGVDDTIEIWPKAALEAPRMSAESFQSKIKEIFS
ncbi:MAG: division/cell wall cluster transcriptional repressor MraZ [Bacteroidales bacterium]|nr:division/cell wall cluster transcriptional repressor MraZ [Bacteroidales bacterium]